MTQITEDPIIGERECTVKKNIKKNKDRIIDLTGERFGKLVITRKKENDPDDPIKQRRVGAWWFADCDCGTKDVIVKGSYLRAGRVKSCGCYNREASHIKNTIDLTGQKYGMLTVIEEAPEEKERRKSDSVMWRCICECGNETVVSSNSLRRKNGTVSCGCLNSKNEWKIKKYLDQLQINYIPQYWFDDLRSPITGWLLKYDIAVMDNGQLSFLIEYDGEQHEYGSRFSHDPEVNKIKFERTKMYDELKNQYCINHNIDLLRISYKDKDNLYSIIDDKLKEKGLLSYGIQETSS